MSKKYYIRMKDALRKCFNFFFHCTDLAAIRIWTTVSLQKISTV